MAVTQAGIVWLLHTLDISGLLHTALHFSCMPNLSAVLVLVLCNVLKVCAAELYKRLVRVMGTVPES